MDALGQTLSQALADLGDTPARVAAVLRTQGCRENPDAALYSEGCPLSVYLGRLLGPGPEWRVSVCRENVAVWHLEDAEDVDDWPEPAALIPCPRAIEGFVRGFDRGDYPALAAP